MAWFARFSRLALPLRWAALGWAGLPGQDQLALTKEDTVIIIFGAPDMPWSRVRVVPCERERKRERKRAGES